MKLVTTYPILLYQYSLLLYFSNSTLPVFLISMFSIVMFFKSYPRIPIPLHASSVKSLNTMLLEPLDNLQYEELGDNCIQNFHLGRYIVEYTVRNSVLRRRISVAVKRDFRTYIRRYTSQNENFEYGYP